MEHETIVIEQNKPPQPQPPTSTQGPKDNISQIAGLLCMALIGSFFVPWLHWLGLRPSGFDIQKSGGEANLLWILPAFAICTLLVIVEGSRVKFLERVTGLVPFVGIVYLFSKTGFDVWHAFDIGVYAALVCGALLFFLPVRRI